MYMSCKETGGVTHSTCTVVMQQEERTKALLQLQKEKKEALEAQQGKFEAQQAKQTAALEMQQQVLKLEQEELLNQKTQVGILVSSPG